ncbi:MAG: ABC transporter ATP-binding protein, partial [Candidatus Latescibacteria bacterium]|nr:ABC transporter ATP-binding protein [Candidatus Latescibacterota bacterium]
MNPALRVDSLTKCFGDVEALTDVDLEVNPDELLVILGPTGAGKTTLLRAICGLEAPDAGTIQIGKKDITHAMPAERDIALVFQNFSLYPDWSVRENITFPLRAPGRNHTVKEIEERVAWAADILKISHLLERGATKLSGGEMQRVAIGRAIVRRPALFLMDEPLTNLDAKLRESLRVELVTLRRELGTPMIFVTHDQVEAMSMGDRIAVLNHGRILQEGGPESVYSHPVSPEVALQLGSPPINIIKAARTANDWVAKDGTLLVTAVQGPDSSAATI